MQAKDIPDKLVLEILSKHQGEWAFLRDNGELHWNSTGYDNPIKIMENAPKKVVLAKFRSLIKRGLVGGCDCGCRGDFEITDKGLTLIGKERTVRYNGY